MAADTLHSMAISSPGEADTFFGVNPGLLIARPGRSCWKPYFVIPEGYYAIVTHYGAEIPYEDNMPLWPPGFHYGYPWRQVAYLVTKQIIVFDAPCVGVLTSDNVTINIDVVITFRIKGDPDAGEDPNDVIEFVHRCPPTELQIRMQAAIDQGIKSMARSIKHTEAYALVGVGAAASKLAPLAEGFSESMSEESSPVLTQPKQVGDPDEAAESGVEFTDIYGAHEAGLEEKTSSNINKGLGVTAAMRTTLNQMFNKDGVEILDVVVTDVAFQNSSIQNQLEGKTMVISENANERMTQQKTMRDIKNSEELETMEQKFHEEYIQTEVDGKRAVSEAQLRLNNLKATVAKEVKEVTTEGSVRVEQMKADTNLKITQLKQEAASILTTYRAQAEAEAQRERDVTELYCETKRSEAELEVAKNRAQASRILSQAEGEIAPMVEALKEHETALKRLEVYQALAENESVVIAGSDSEDINAMLLADDILKSHRPGTAPSRSVMMAEMLLGQKTLKLHMHEGTEGDS